MHFAHSQLLHHYTHKSHVEQSLDSQYGDMFTCRGKLQSKDCIELDPFKASQSGIDTYTQTFDHAFSCHCN